jgi:hypothetical protein
MNQQQPIVYSLTSIPKQISLWPSILSVRTTLVWIMQDFQGGQLPQPELSKMTAGACSGANLLWYTGANTQFSSCPPYTGNSGSNSNTLARLILGGSPAPPPGVSLPGPVQIPNLLAITRDDTQLA